MSTDLYPPLTSLDLMPLHGGHIGRKRGPFACLRPELPFAAVLVDWRCSNCLAIAEQEVARHPRETVVWAPSIDEAPRPVRLAWLIERAHYWRPPADPILAGEP